LQQVWTGRRVVELEGPQRVTPLELGATFSKVLGRPVQVKAILRSSWEELFRSQGMTNPEPRMQMLDGFNQGWIEFESGEAGSRKGLVELESVLRSLVRQQSE
jgi:NAD(P)H dehydrogenase (quinone)